MATLAELIAQFEGYNVAGSLAQRNNNPGNLRSGPNQIGTDSKGFAIFASPTDGWAALDHQIQLDAGRGLTLSEFINKYAPPTENNTTSYLNWLSSGLNANPDTLLTDVLSTSGGSSGNPTKPQLSTHQSLAGVAPKGQQTHG